ncbi:MAG: radical SAM protein [Desulfatibacillaceae bacterium]|nr:radical SAM protein [Desulfatibacillaceae bacterium]
MRIALVMLPCWSVFTPPLNLSYIARVLRQEGHAVTVFDFNARLWRAMQGQEEDWWDFAQYERWQNSQIFEEQTLPTVKPLLDSLLKEIASRGFEAVGFSVFHTTAPCVRYASKMLKEACPGIKIVWGGPACTPHWVKGDIEEETVDAVVIGEGEATAPELFNALAKGASICGMAGVAARGADGKMLCGKKRPPVLAHELPLPRYDDYDLSLYRFSQLPIMMSRGCTGACTFCQETVFFKPYRMRPAAHIVEEIEQDIKQYGIREFSTCDSLLNGNHKILEQVADLICERRLDISWGGYARLDRRLTVELLGKLKKAGCKWLSFGLESGSQKVLDLMNKGISLEQAAQTIKATFEAGIEAHINLIVGFPGETEDDFDMTLDFISGNWQSISIVNTGETLGVGPGMTLFEKPKAFGILTDKLYCFRRNWTFPLFGLV